VIGRRRKSKSRKRLRSAADRPSPLSPAEQIGRFFRSTRESQNLSQEQLAALTRARSGPVSRAMISAVERGRHLPGLDVMLALSQVLHVSPTEVLERLELARGDSQLTEGLSYEELEQRASESFWSGNPRHAASCYDAMLQLLDLTPPRSKIEKIRQTATCELRRGAALRRCGATSAARSAVERAISLADGQPEIQVQAYFVLTALLIQLGRLPLARDAADRALTLSSKLDSVKLVGWAWIEKGEVLTAGGNHEQAREAFLEARRFVRQAGDWAHAVKVEGNIGHCLHELGRLGQAERRFRAAVVLARRHKLPNSEALWLVELGRLAFDGDRFDDADTRASAALKIAKEKDDFLTCFRAEWLRHLVHEQWTSGEPDRHRVAYLRRLYVKLEEHQGIPEIREFKAVYCSTSMLRNDA